MSKKKEEIITEGKGKKMNKHAVYHKINSAYACAMEVNSIAIVVRVAKNDMKTVTVHYYNRFNSCKVETKGMNLLYSDSLFDYYFLDITLENGSCVYYFKLTDSLGETAYFSEMGFSDNPPERIGSYEMLALHKTEINEYPQWLSSAIFYQIFPDRFNKSGDEKAPNAWGETPTYFSKMGGNLKGMTEKLGYLSELNINAIYLTPIFASSSCHRYDTSDYYKIEPMLGSEEDAKAFVAACHKKGIRVVLDAVFNHCSSEFFAFKDVLKNGKDSKYIDWFYIDGFPLIEGNTKKYATFADEKNMPRLNTENSEVAEYLIKAAEYWTKKLDIDGWRLDVADEVCSLFWRSFRKRLKAIKPSIFILGEVWHSGEYYLQNKFDSTMNYLFYDNVTRFMFKGIHEFKDRIVRQLMLYPKNHAKYCFNLIDSHDTARAITSLGKERFMAAVVFMFCFTGVPCIYYGDERGLSGSADPDNRRCIDFSSCDNEIFSLYKDITALRKNYKPLTMGDFIWKDYACLAFERNLKGEKIVVYINTGSESVLVPLKSGDVLLEKGREGHSLLPNGFIVVLLK